MAPIENFGFDFRPRGAKPCHCEPVGPQSGRCGPVPIGTGPVWTAEVLASAARVAYSVPA